MRVLQRHLKLFLFVFIAMASYSTYGQGNTILLHGKIRSQNNTVSDILVVNLITKKSTITDAKGFFSIEVRLRDSIKITAGSVFKKTNYCYRSHF